MSLNGVRENVDDILFLIYTQKLSFFGAALTVKLDEKLTSLASPHTDGAVSSAS